VVAVIVLAGLAVAGIAAVVTSGGKGDSSVGVSPGKVASPGLAVPGDQAPDFTLTSLSGKTVSLASLRGKPVVVNFWASWCIPCREEFPLLRAAYRKYRSEGLQMVGITYRDIDPDARDFARRQHADWTLLSGGRDNSVARAYGVRAVPQTFFVDANGRIVRRFYQVASEDRFRSAVEDILSPGHSSQRK
jgi:cytochrome c biogenesis protein CcmG/thiol:disulfide interchange protein DsbE